MSDTHLDSSSDPATEKAADQLDYIADLLLELREIAERADALTLSSMLALAQVEAAREVRMRRQSRTA